MSTLKTEKIDKALRKKGFKNEQRDHNYYFYYYNGKKSAINTKTSHGKDEIGDSLIGMMAKQLHLKKEQFMQLIITSKKRTIYATNTMYFRCRYI